MESTNKMIGHWISFYRQIGRYSCDDLALYLHCSTEKIQLFESTGVIPPKMLWKIGLFFSLPIGAFCIGLPSALAHQMDKLSEQKEQRPVF